MGLSPLDHRTHQTVESMQRRQLELRIDMGDGRKVCAQQSQSDSGIGRPPPKDVYFNETAPQYTFFAASSSRRRPQAVIDRANSLYLHSGEPILLLVVVVVVVVILLLI